MSELLSANASPVEDDPGFLIGTIRAELDEVAPHASADGKVLLKKIDGYLEGVDTVLCTYRRRYVAQLELAELYENNKVTKDRLIASLKRQLAARTRSPLLVRLAVMLLKGFRR